MLFTPVSFGPLTIRNRSIRAAAFEGMCQNHEVTENLIQYHQSVAKGGIGMTTVAYAAINKSGLSFPHQLHMRAEIIPQLIKLTDAVHKENAAASIQLGHCGNMAKHQVIGSRPLSASTHINWYAPCFAKAMNHAEINATVKDFGKAVHLAQQAGFDAVEVHAGHGYLISQFLSPYTNKRTDAFGGSLENRMRFMKMVIEEVLTAAAGKTAVLVKMNMRDGFSGGMELKESLQVAKTLEQLGVHGLVLSGGFVSKAPMYVMRGKMPFHTLSQHTDNAIMGLFVKLFGKFLVPDVAFEPNYFLKDALHFRKNLKLPLVYVGGILSKENIEEALRHGFDAVAIARALIKDPDFIQKILEEQLNLSSCDTCNHCIAVMYSGPFSCIQNESKSI
jgi:2,4-dienoyl-CoA reductase-like NADH-dependent reductase (Old Yellow Enzyme family)